MTNDDPPRDDVLEQNVARLIGRAYRPETPDPAFAARVEDRLLARSRADGAPPSLLSRLVAGAAAAALLAGVLALGQRDSDPVHRPGRAAPSLDGATTATLDPEPAIATPAFSGVGGSPRALADAPDVPAVDVGDTLLTVDRDRRLVALPDGTRLYMDAATKVDVTGRRSLRLRAGRVFLEVRHDPSDPFRITTEDRTVEALGTRFALDARGAGTDVLVTQGRVRVDGVAAVLTSGQQLGAGEEQVRAATGIPQTLAWTRDLMAAAQSPLVPESADRGGALVALDPWGQEMRLELRRMHVDVHIRDGFARTTIDQTYFNHTRRRLEGTFRFPLPADASLSRLAMYVAGVRMEGGMTERRHGRDVYETIVNRRMDPALLEWIDGSTFKMRVFPLEAREEKRIVLSYTQRLAPEGGRRTYRFPAGHDLIAVGSWSFRAHVHGGAATAWSSPTHALDAAASGDDLDLTASGANVSGQDDVVLVLDDPDALEPGAARFASFEHGGHRYLMARYRPALDTAPVRRRRDWVVTFERSGERDPVVARAQIEVLREWLRQAEPDDTFTILALHTGVHRLTPEPLPATEAHIAAALAQLGRIHLIGGLDLRRGLDAARDVARTLRDPVLLHLGSGVASLGERDPGELARALDAEIPFVGIAVGRRWSRPFLAAAASRTGGLFAHVLPDEPLRFRALELQARFAAPRLLGAVAVDASESAPFLAFDDAIADGQEFAAVTRVAQGEALPTSLVVSGRVDGATVSRTLTIANVATGAGYLPRQWARLELERLAREDAVGNRAAIVALSKSSYVMSPFTSLLVLETPEMYRQFGVDTGRSDHWALYDCPEKIPVVREPQDGAPSVDEHGNVVRPTVAEILQTILIRDRRPVLQSPYGWRGYYGTQTVAQAMEMARSQGLSLWHGADLGFGFDEDGDGADGPAFPSSGLGGSARAGGKWFSGLPRPSSGVQGPLGFGSGGGGARTSTATETRATSALEKVALLRQWGQADSFGPSFRNGLEFELFPSGATAVFGRNTRTRADLTLLPFTMSGAYRGPGGAMPPDSRAPFDPPPPELEMSSWGGLRDRIAPYSLYGYGYGSGAGAYDFAVQQFVNRLTYNRPNPNNDVDLWSDLLAFAPGMNTTASDISAVVEAEARPQPASRPGRIDDDAARLIGAARETGWRRVRLPGVVPGAAFDVVFAGDGRLAFERRLECGLREVVVNDGATLTHLYPEIGVGARRSVSRFHRAELFDLLPFVVPPAADLAHGADVVAAGPRAVDRIPHAQEDGARAEPIVRYVLGPDDRLAEIAWRVDLASAPLRRLRFEETRVVWLDGDGKEMASRDFDVADESAAPDLAPDASTLVVLPLPYRTQQHVQTTLSIANPNDASGWDDATVHAMAGAQLGQNPHGLLQVLGRRYLARGDHRPGVYTLLLSSGYHTSRGTTTRIGSFTVELDPLLGGRTDPLAVYIDAQMRRRSGSRNEAFPRLPGPSDTFLAELAEYGSLVDLWNTGRANQQGAEREALIERTFEFVESAGWTRPAWGVLHFLWNHGIGNQEPHRDRLAAAVRRFEGTPGLEYVTRYETARALLSAGQADRARERFRDLYVETLDAGGMPPTDWAFVQALNQSTNGTEQDRYAQLLEEQCARLVERGEGARALWLAYQGHRLGQGAAGDAVFARISAGADPEDQVLQLTAVQYLRHVGRIQQAQVRLGHLLERPSYARVGAYWRQQATLCQMTNDLYGTTRALERLFDLESARLPDVVDLQAVRADHQWLFGFYRQVASGARAARADGAPPSTAFLTRVVRAADRWRELDTDDAIPCYTAAQVLLAAGANELAWDYLTTPLAQRPNEPGPWTQLATQLAASGDLESAQRAYANAFDVETSNPQHLWEQAALLVQLGRPDEARALYDRIADGTWQPRFSAVQARARAIRSR